MSTTMQDALLEAEDPRAVEEQARREAIQGLDPDVLAEVAITQYAAQVLSRYREYVRTYVRLGDTTGWMPSSSADGIGQELHAALDQAASQLLTQAAMGRA